MNSPALEPVIVGIDLGTTTSLVATLASSGDPVVLEVGGHADRRLPSAVCLQPRNEGVGEEPRRRAALGEPLTYTRFKRTAMASGEEFAGPEGPVTAVDLSARILKTLIETKALEGRKIGKAVVTVPAAFDHAAREATMTAARQAGLGEVRLVNEPTAAAIYYVWQKGGKFRGNLAVFDMGGGTLDITILHANGWKVEVLATGGLIDLGGIDFDDALKTFVRSEYQARSGGSLELKDYTVIEAERAKINLSKYPEERVKVRGNMGKLTLVISREDFEELITPLLSRVPELIAEVVKRSGIAVDDIDQLLAVGGSTRIPAVLRMAEDHFGREPVKFDHIDQVVAKGAVVFAAKEAQEMSRANRTAPQTETPAVPALEAHVVDALDHLEVFEQTSKSFGTDAINAHHEEYYSEIIPLGAEIPCKKEKKYIVLSPGESSLPCKILESSDGSKDINSARLVAKVNLPLRPNRNPKDTILVTFGYDKNQMMTCEFQDGPERMVKTVKISRG